MWLHSSIEGSDLIPGFVCFLVCLFHELELGIAAGVAVQLLVILYHSARPPVEVDIKTVIFNA